MLELLKELGHLFAHGLAKAAFEKSGHLLEVFPFGHTPENLGPGGIERVVIAVAQVDHQGFAIDDAPEKSVIHAEGGFFRSG